MNDALAAQHMPDIQTALNNATQLLSKTSDSAALDAEVLLCHVLDKPRSHLRAWPEKTLQNQQSQQFETLINLRQQGEPIAYITGHKEFWSREFEVSPAVLIPRPDTELLIELSLNLLTNKSDAQIIDLGTGSGAIAITLAAERTDIKVIASDLSTKALEIAKNNANKHTVNNIQFIQSNWFNNIPLIQFDLIISNPPYIDSSDPHLSEGDVRFEPDSALIADDHGLQDINSLCNQARQYLKADATLLIEHGFDQKEAVQAIFKSFDYTQVTTYSDLSGNPRVTSGQRNKQ